MLNENTWCVIMAGGNGTRFWPISTASLPKQFIPIEGQDATFLQNTAARFSNLVPAERTLVVTNRKFENLVYEQLPQIPKENILLEPYNRDTAPCLALATYTILKRDPDAMMIVTPSDHIIRETAKFEDIIRCVTEDVRGRDVLGTIGIFPEGPDTNYGYIQTSGVPQLDSFIKVKTFTEKPDLELAKVFLESGDFLWNSGIFIWKADTIRSEIERFMPQMAASFSGWEGAIDTPSQAEFLDSVYADLQNISIDYAIMERTDNAWTYPASIGWHDVGNFESIYGILSRGENGVNATNCKIMTKDAVGNLMLSTDKSKLIAVCGMDELMVIDTPKVTLVCPRDNRKFREFISNLALPEFEKYR